MTIQITFSQNPYLPVMETITTNNKKLKSYLNWSSNYKYPNLLEKFVYSSVSFDNYPIMKYSIVPVQKICKEIIYKETKRSITIE